MSMLAVTRLLHSKKMSNNPIQKFGNAPMIERLQVMEQLRDVLCHEDKEDDLKM